MQGRCVKRVALAVLVATMAMADDTAPPTTDLGPCEELFRLANTMDFDHAWTGTIRLRQMEPSCVGSENERTYWQIRAQMENLLGNHREALEHFARNAPESGDDLPANAESRPAIPYILARARGHRVVMVNEQHHVSTERLLTLELLRPLYGRGFRYLAAEALWAGEEQLNRRGYPIRETGGYVSDVVFGELVREALSIGYEVVPYEASQEQMQPTETMTFQQARDYWQAQNLIAATLERDPEAKVLVHCGYDHLVEEARPGWTPMAHYFREATGIDPLTVDQTVFAVRGAEEAEHPWRLAAEVRGLVEDRPVVLVDAEGNLLPAKTSDMDIRVFNPRTEYRNGRPQWMTLGGRRAAVAIGAQECIEEACVVEAFNVAWEERAIPYDRVEIKSAKVDMYLPLGVDVNIRGYRLDGSLAFRRILHGVPLGTSSGIQVPDPYRYIGNPRSHRIPLRLHARKFKEHP